MAHQDRKKESSIYIRINEHEKAEWTALAVKENMTFSEWVRWVLRKEAERERLKNNES